MVINIQVHVEYRRKLEFGCRFELNWNFQMSAQAFHDAGSLNQQEHKKKKEINKCSKK